MKDKFKDFIKQLPELEPREDSVEKIVWKIIRREAKKLWEKRLLAASAFVCFGLGILVFLQILRVAVMLDSAGFWQLIMSEKSWLLKDFPAVWLIFTESHPLKEMGILLLPVLYIHLFCLLFYE